MNKFKIIGYKCPTDLWDGQIKKGTLYVTNKDLVNNYTIESDFDDRSYCIPKEIVKNWEPVCENDYNIGDWVLTSDNAWGYGNLSEDICNKILQITEIKNKRFYFNKLQTDIREIVRKATPKEIENAQSIEVFMAVDFIVIVKNNRVYHKRDNCDITDYVKSIKKWYDSIPKILDNYSFSIMPEDITIIKSGCQSKRTTIKQWLDLANKLK